MFEYSTAHWSSFIIVCILLTIAPGPDLAFILAKTAKGGKRAGFQALYGVWSGAFVHVVLAALGLSAVLSSSAVAFSVVKYCGAAYLVWLGISSFTTIRLPFFKSKTPKPSARSEASFLSKEESEGEKAPNRENIFRQGVLVAILNPKTALFFLAFLPQFTTASAGPISAQLFLHGSLVIVTAVLIEPFFVLGGHQVFSKIKNAKTRTDRQNGSVLDKILGLVFIALGLKLAFTAL